MKNLLYLSVVVSVLCFVPVQGDTKSRGASEGGYKECTFIKQNKLISWGRSSNFIQVCFERTGRYGRDEIYMWGTPAGRSGGLKLAKVLPKQILKKDNYTYFVGCDSQGKPLWSSNEDDAQSIIDAGVGEPCVRFNPYLKRWMLTYLKSNSALVMQVSKDPWGPFSAPRVLTTQAQYPTSYNGYMHKKYFENDGKIVYFLMSQFFPIYNVRLMKLEFSIGARRVDTEVSSIGFVTGGNSTNKTTEYDVGGTDLGIMFSHSNKVFLVFGDTFSSIDSKANWRSNTMAFSTDFDASDNIKF